MRGGDGLAVGQDQALTGLHSLSPMIRGILGTMVKDLKQAGTYDSREVLKISVKMGASLSVQRLRVEKETISGPEFLAGFSFQHVLLKNSLAHSLKFTQSSHFNCL